MEYVYVGRGSFYQGLPAADLNDATLSEEQRELLKAGLLSGYYVPKVETDGGNLAKLMVAEDLHKVMGDPNGTQG